MLNIDQFLSIKYKHSINISSIINICMNGLNARCVHACIYKSRFSPNNFFDKKKLYNYYIKKT